MLRNFPFFGIFGSGTYRLQPVFGEDVAYLAVKGAKLDDNVILDAAGPETYTYVELVRLIKRKIRSRSKILHITPRMALLAARFINPVVRDITITKEEITGLMEEKLISYEEPKCKTRFSSWLTENATTLGASYASEVKRHYR